jgi:hypothetical protein
MGQRAEAKPSDGQLKQFRKAVLAATQCTVYRCLCVLLKYVDGFFHFHGWVCPELNSHWLLGPLVR